VEPARGCEVTDLGGGQLRGGVEAEALKGGLLLLLRPQARRRQTTQPGRHGARPVPMAVPMFWAPAGGTPLASAFSQVRPHFGLLLEGSQAIWVICRDRQIVAPSNCIFRQKVQVSSLIMDSL
jgi:hypothetical protein